MKVQLECTYCGHRWIKSVYNKDSLFGELCPHGKCKCKRLIFRDISEKIDYYKGAPPFPIKLVVDKEWY